MTYKDAVRVCFEEISEEEPSEGKALVDGFESSLLEGVLIN